jgi:hypothetical protein
VRAMTGRAMLVALMATLVALAVTSAGCGGSSGAKPASSASPQWTTVFTKDIPGTQPIKVNLGTWALGNGARVGWELSSPSARPPVELSVRIINTSNGIGYGNAMSSGDVGFSTSDPNAIVLNPIWPGKYVVFFSQRFLKGKGPGYDVKLTFSTYKIQK